LASLKKYTLPSEGWFKYLICPHYTFECLLYLSLAVVAAPAGAFFNKSILCTLLFVLGNLGATAYGTKKWYAEKFGADKLVGKWAIIPFVY
jgi:3-oxo-5-alpha-steroid 4-dehydrogenase 3